MIPGHIDFISDGKATVTFENEIIDEKGNVLTKTIPACC
jgi:hypothetical protein